MFCYWSKRIHIYQPFYQFNVVNIICIQLYAGLCRKTTGTTIRGGCSGICPSLVSHVIAAICVCRLTFKPRGLVGRSRQETQSAWAARAAAIGRSYYVNLRGSPHFTGRLNITISKSIWMSKTSKILKVQWGFIVSLTHMTWNTISFACT